MAPRTREYADYERAMDKAPESEVTPALGQPSKYFEAPREKGNTMNSRPRFHGNKYLDALPERDQLLENAIIMGDLEWVKDCVRKGANVNCKLDERSFTPLMLAVEGGWVNIVKYLVENTDVDLEAVDCGGFNATDIAAMNGFGSYEEKMLNADVADIANYLKANGLEYTWWGAIIGHDLDRINEFIQNGQDFEERGGYFCEGNYKMTAFQLAIKHGRLSTARYLMALGCSIPRDLCQIQLPVEGTLKAFS